MSGDAQSPILLDTANSLAPVAVATSPPAITPAINIAPRLAVKQEEPVASGVGIVTHKEWIIPPRPKPGRKPATDMPPTKRKAQNREAQRAFRERRAQRVNELEDQLKKVENEAKDRENLYRNQVQRVTAENNQLRATVSDLRREIEALQRLKVDAQSVLASTTQFNSTLTQVASPAPSLGAENGDTEKQTDARASTRASLRRKANPVVETTNDRRKSPEVIEIDDDEDETMAISTRSEGCCGGGRCGRSGGCGSMLNSTVSIHHLHKRHITPDTNPTKRSRFVNALSELETDFTDVYMSTSRKNSQNQNTGTPSSAILSPASNMPIPDPCGFCSNGTPCVCAEVAQMQREEEEDQRNFGMMMDTTAEDHTLPPLLSNFTPPLMSDEGVSGSKPEAMHPPPTSEFVGCTGQPGTCSQCQSDPMSTLFCRTLASRMKNTSNGTADGACCGGTACGKNNQPADDSSRTNTIDNNESLPSLSSDPSGAYGTYIPCSAAYQTLSRHQRFEEASADLGQLVGKLNTKGMQVEVSSVRDVLKYLDREFGKGGSH